MLLNIETGRYIGLEYTFTVKEFARTVTFQFLFDCPLYKDICMLDAIIKQMTTLNF